MPAPLNAQAWMRDVHQLQVPGSGLQIKVGSQAVEGAVPLHVRHSTPLLGCPYSPNTQPQPHPPHPQDCFDLNDARRSYFQQLFPLNPGGITPSGPDPGLDVPAGRGSGRWQDAFHLKSCSVDSVSA